MMLKRCLSRLSPVRTLRFAPLSAARRAAAGLCLAAATHLAVAPALAQETNMAGRGLPLVRDAETEQLLRDYLNPILKAAGVPGGSTEIVLINDPRFNAFVADSHRVFINTGVIMQSKTPNEVIGVLAHETGHMAGNHLIKLHEEMAKAQLIAAVGMLIGAGAVAAGAASGSSSIGNGGAAAMSGGLGIAQRSLLAYQRSEEEAADRAALKYLLMTKQSAKGMVETFRRLANEEIMVTRYADPYAQTHPFSRERLAAVETLAEQSPYWDVKDPPALQARHDMVRAKLTAFTGQPSLVSRQYPPTDKSLPAQYARAIIAYRVGDPQGALQQIDALIKQQPKNPYFWELKGQALLEGGRPRDAVAPLRQAVALAPSAGPIRIMYGQALANSGDPAMVKQAIVELQRAAQQEPEDTALFRSLATAYAAQGNIPMADLSTARGIMAAGSCSQARRYAARAQAALKPGSPAWLQADDIISCKPPRLGRG